MSQADTCGGKFTRYKLVNSVSNCHFDFERSLENFFSLTVNTSLFANS